MFKVGDIIRGINVVNNYTYTNEDGLMVVSEVFPMFEEGEEEYGDMNVSIVAHHYYERRIGETWWVDMDHFRLATKDDLKEFGVEGQYTVTPVEDLEPKKDERVFIRKQPGQRTRGADLPYASPKTQGEYEEWLEDTDERISVSDWMYIFNDYTRGWIGQVCNSEMNDGIERAYTKAGKLYWVVFRVWDESVGGLDEEGETLEVNHKATLAYLRHLTLHSTLSNYIWNTSVKSVLDDGLIMKGDVPGNMMLHIITAYRQIWEYPDVVENWYRLVKGGVDADVALVLNHFVRRWGLSNKLMSETRHDTGHSPFSGIEVSSRDIINFVKDEPENLNEPFGEVYRYTDVNSVWSPEGRDSVIEWEPTPTKTAMVDSAWGGGKEERHTYMYEDAISQLIEFGLANQYRWGIGEKPVEQEEAA